MQYQVPADNPVLGAFALGSEIWIKLTCLEDKVLIAKLNTLVA